eukprot:4469963-Pleurochrysis_carterae.AAC.4
MRSSGRRPSDANNATMAAESELNAAVNKLLKNTPAAFKVVTETIHKVLSNVITYPDDPKYRELRRDSNTFTSKIASCAGGVAFLKASGFTSDDRCMRLTEVDVDVLKAARAQLKAAVKQYNAMCQELQQKEKEEAAIKLKELQEATRKRRAKQDAESAALRDSILRGVEVLAPDLLRLRFDACCPIDRHERDRQLDPTNMNLHVTDMLLSKPGMQCFLLACMQWRLSFAPVSALDAF